MNKNYNKLINNIGTLLEKGRKQAVYAVNNILVQTYWQIGKQIVEFEQGGKERAGYGSNLLIKLSKDLTFKYGKGFSLSNLKNMRLFYMQYSKSQTVSGESKKIQTVSGLFEKNNFLKQQTVSAQLSWSHYVELLGIEEDLERSFYEKQCVNENWSIRELQRQIESALFYRIALGRDKKGILQLSKKGQQIQKPQDIVKDPYILEFLKIKENHSEKEIEQKIINNLQEFLLELGKGFTFVARQYKISFGNNHYYIDLVFYNRILKCFVLIDLKINKAIHSDVGQMNMYLNYFKTEENSKEDNAPIGIILSAKKNDIEIDYALGGISNNLFVSKYRIYLPNKKELEQKLKELLE